MGTPDGTVPFTGNQLLKHVLLLISAHYDGYLLLISVNTVVSPRRPPAWLPAAIPALFQPPPPLFFFINQRNGNTFWTSLQDPMGLTRFVPCQPG